MVFRLRRFTTRRLLVFGSAFILFWTFIFTLTPLTSPIPPYTGRHEVGILDLETEVERRVIDEARLKETGDRQFELRTLAITLYYPSSLSTPPHVRPQARPWLPQPISLIGTGYARIAHISWPPLQSVFTFLLWALGSGTTIPGIVDAPILSGQEKVVIDESGGTDGLSRVVKASQFNEELKRDDSEMSGADVLGKLPMVVFTHGMAGMSQSYSHYLGSIASHGVVVAAIEHRDGSGPGSIIHYPDGKEREVWHVESEDFLDDPSLTKRDLQIAQLAFREAEIEETIRLFRRLNDGTKEAPITNLKPNSPESALPGFANRLNLSAITVAGHSYGATGALQALKNAPSKSMPVIGGIALDPGKGSGPLNHEIDVPVLVLHSGMWTEKQSEFYGQGFHFDVVRKLVQSVKQGWFLTLTGSAHPSCTDAPLIVPWIMKLVTGTTLESRVALREYIDISVDFLEYLKTGKKRGPLLDSKVSSPRGPLGEKADRGRVKGPAGGSWEVHVVPQ